ncbi:MAG: tyrosine-type recombinase/integrase [Albidovulum sp.]|nr:tyrosine-type recombinase/integrase [Albidovulum sp.]
MWIGRRDNALLLVGLQTGLRTSEPIAPPCENLHNQTGAHLQWQGKCRKDRAVPLRRDSVAALRVWIEERCGSPNEPVFAKQRGRPLTHDSLGYHPAQNLAVAGMKCPSLPKKRVSPHSLRHTCAMTPPQNGVDQATIALWLELEPVATTCNYLHAGLGLKEQAMAKTTPFGKPVQTYQPEDKVPEFLNGLRIFRKIRLQVPRRSNNQVESGIIQNPE